MVVVGGMIVLINVNVGQQTLPVWVVVMESVVDTFGLVCCLDTRCGLP